MTQLASLIQEMQSCCFDCWREAQMKLRRHVWCLSCGNQDTWCGTRHCLPHWLWITGHRCSCRAAVKPKKRPHRAELVGSSCAVSTVKVFLSFFYPNTWRENNGRKAFPIFVIIIIIFIICSLLTSSSWVFVWPLPYAHPLYFSHLALEGQTSGGGKPIGQLCLC